MDYSDHKAVVDLRKDAIDDEREIRRRCREQKKFLHERDGQWQDDVIRKMGQRPRFTFDHTSRVIRDISSEIEQTEFGGRVIAKGGQARGELATTYDGILRSIQNLSSADQIYKHCGREIVECGFSAFMLVTDWADSDAFEQDILYRPIHDAVNRVWLDYDWAEVDRSDSRWGFIDWALDKEEYKETFKDGTGSSLDDVRAEGGKECDDIVGSDFYYLKSELKTLHLLTDGRVVLDEQYQPVAADLALRNIHVERSRTRKVNTCYMRKFDAGGWLTDEQATVFEYVPIVPVYGNLRVMDGEISYYGETEKLMDPQRVYNYARSREIEEGALSPRDKIAMTPKQAQGHEAQLRTLNSNADPVQFYNPDDKAPPPYKLGATQINGALVTTAQTTAQDIQDISGNFAPSQGKPISGHSGVAYELLQNKSDNGNNHYAESLKVSISYGGKIATKAIPKVYDTRDRQVRTMSEDGSIDFVTINQEENGKVIRDLSQGHYDFEVVAGPAFKNRKTEGLNTMLELMRIDPTILQDGQDILVKSMDVPYVNQLAERIRAQMIKDGRIPEKQLTDDEREKIVQEIQNQQPDPTTEATLRALDAQTQKLLSDIQIEQRKFINESALNAAKIENTMADTLKKIKEAMGADKIVSPNAIEAYSETAQNLTQ